MREKEERVHVLGEGRIGRVSILIQTESVYTFFCVRICQLFQANWGLEECLKKKKSSCLKENVADFEFLRIFFQIIDKFGRMIYCDLPVKRIDGGYKFQ